MDWFNTIRAARFHYLQVAFPVAAVSEVRTHAHTQTIHIHVCVIKPFPFCVCTHTTLIIHKHLFVLFFFLLIAVAKINQEFHQGGLHGEDRAKGNALNL